jgi:SAM-dependent methyltransferase
MRTRESIAAHYEIERELASRLRNCKAEERRTLYSAVYDELFRRVPDHPMLTQKEDPEASKRAVRAQLRLVRRFLRPDSAFLEVGPGDCALSYAVAQEARHVFAVDVSEVISNAASRPPNFELFISDGVSIPVPPASVTVAFSNQLMEHLHPDDAKEQLQNIFKSLGKGGIYLCITPNALSGPHDVSRFFDKEATGFHLKEYTCSELHRLFQRAGFAKTRALFSIRGHSVLLPVWICGFFEWIVRMLPYRIGRELAGRLPLRLFLGVQMVGFRE